MAGNSIDFTRQIDGYCERTSPEFWAEPINAVTNAAFLVAAGICFVMARRADRLDGAVIWLIALMSIIGIGSFLFHTFATVWAAIADTAPIMIFILTYFTISMRYFGGLSWPFSISLTINFILVLVGLSWVLNTLLRDVIGGSVSYLPALMALLAVGLWLHLRGHPAGVWLMVVAVIFGASLTSRAIDEPLCDSIPHGTHWLWHTLNGVVLGTLTVALIRNGRRETLDGGGGAA